MRFEILGPLRIGGGDARQAITAGRDRVVLSMLLLHPGSVLAIDELIDAVWEDGPPVTARAQLHTCVSRLRRALSADTIITDPAGYGIDVRDDDLDAALFARLTTSARRLVAEAPDEARQLFRTALDLWRGPALVGLDSRAVRRGAAVLDEQHAVAIEDWVDLELSGGRERDLIGELAGLVEQFPLRERLRGHFMLALYRSGRQADALAEFRRTRALLRDELGIEPGPHLRELHRRMLTGDVPVVTGPRPRHAAPPVRRLPRTVGDFTGRAATVDRLLQAVADSDPAKPAVVLVDGMAGSGKTTVALHVADRLVDRYPDAQLFIDLHGHSENQPVEPAAALTSLLRQLGVEAELIPTDPEDRAALWHTEMASRRALVVLDNAAATAQVMPLLPAASGCVVLVTSRRRLTGLDGVRPESLPVLTPDEAVAMLTRIVGDRVLEEPQAAAEVVRRCGGLPLALRLAGARLAHRPRWRVADLVRRLGEATLPELIAEDRTVANAFALSYGQLDEPARRMFRTLGVHPVDNFDALTAAASTGLPANEAQGLLDHLVDVHLVEEPEVGVFRMHDLVREYADTLARHDAGTDRPAALGRLLNFHLHATLRAVQRWERSHPMQPLDVPAAERPDLVAAVDDPLARLERDRVGIIALQDCAVAIGRPEYAWLLPWASWRYLWVVGYYEDLTRTHQRGAAAARAAGNLDALAGMLNYQASGEHLVWRYDEALALLRESAQLRAALGDVHGEAITLGNIAIVHEHLGNLSTAIEISTAVLQLHRRTGEVAGMDIQLGALGNHHALVGNYDVALRHQRARLQLGVEERRDLSIASGLLGVAEVRVELGELEPALRLLRAAQRLFEVLGFKIAYADVLGVRGKTLLRQGKLAAAADAYRQALATAVDIGERRDEALFLNGLARVTLAQGDREEAESLHRRAYAIAVRARVRPEQGRALDGIARCVVDDRPEAARQHWEQALAIFSQMGVPERFEVDRRLAELGSPAAPRREDPAERRRLPLSGDAPPV